MKPRTDYQDHLNGVMQEIVSAMSSLNMPPERIKDCSDDRIYLSETDFWANHAIEHLREALNQLRKHERKLKKQQLTRKL